MGCRNGGDFQDDEEQRRSQSSLVNDALLLTTMCIIGLPVDVHIKDGSVYSGIFHTACVDDRYAIVLKQARMTKKGSCESNVANEGVIETLIIQSGDLVQVVAKRVLLPADGFTGHETGDDTEAVACTFLPNGTPQIEANKTSSKSNIGQLHINQKRPEPGVHSSNALEVDKNADARGSRKIHEVQAKPSKFAANGVISDGSASVAKRRETQTSAEPLSFADASATVSSESTPTETVAPKISNSNRTTKEFKLNPGAKIFSPSFPNKRSVTPPAVPTGGNLAYIPDNYPALPVATAQPEVEIGPYAPRSLPVKFVPYGNLLSANGGGEVQHPQPIVGYMTNRTHQPVRYGGQYHPVQTAPAYVQPSSQNVMVGRLGPLVYVHPVSQEMVQSTAGFSQVSTCSILTPHQVHVPKHQGSAAAQALQLCATPPFIAAGGQTPFVLPSHIPISQPPYPVIRPISVPGSNGFLVSKFS